MLVDFCLPIKNEAAILRDHLGRLLAYARGAGFDFSWRIIGLINGSTDDSVKIFAEFKERFPNFVDYQEIAVAGRGRALKKYWSDSRADILVYMDADLAVSLNDLPALLSPLLKNESDLTIGSRFVPGAQTKRSCLREFVSLTYNFLSRLLLNHDTKDSQCGFKAVRRELFEKLQPLLFNPHWFFDTELVVLAKHFGYRVQEIPVDWRENRYSHRPSTVKLIKDILFYLKSLFLFRRRLKRLRKNRHNPETD